MELGPTGPPTDSMLLRSTAVSIPLVPSFIIFVVGASSVVALRRRSHRASAPHLALGPASLPFWSLRTPPRRSRATDPPLSFVSCLRRTFLNSATSFAHSPAMSSTEPVAGDATAVADVAPVQSENEGAGLTHIDGSAVPAQGDAGSIASGSSSNSVPVTAAAPPAVPMPMTFPTAVMSSTASGPAGSSIDASSAASGSLYVGDLHPEITESNLQEIFQALGPMSSIRVCRDVVTRRSLGYAYVNFHNVQDAERALESMNYHSSELTKGRPMRIMWKARDPAARRQGQGNIYVKGLVKSIDNKSLYDTFSQFGKILSCKVATDDSGQSLGYGFVHFQTPESAKMATESVNGMMLEGRKVYVGPFLNKKEREAAGQVHKTFTNVYVKNIDDALCTEEKIRDLFADYGAITSVHVPLTNDSQPKGFAFINFESPEMARKATDEMNGKEIEGKAVFVGRAQKKSEREMELRSKFEAMKMERMQKLQGVNLYVKNLSDDIDDDKLREEFLAYGTITSCKIMRDDKGQSRGFGFVCFTQPEEATKAVTELNGRMFGSKPIYVALAQRKEARRAQLEQQRNLGQIRIPGPGLPGPAAAMYGQPSPYLFQPAPGMSPQMAHGPGGMVGGRGNPGFINPQYLAAMGRGGPIGRGAPMNPQYMAAMGRGQGVNPAAMNPAAMAPYGMVAQRQTRQNRQRGGPMGGPGGPGGVAAGGRGGATGQQQFRYPMNTRNGNVANGSASGGTGMPNAHGSSQQGQQRGQPAEVDSSAPLTIEQLSAATPQQQKQLLGEKLFPLIGEREKTLAGKITGMLLEMENSDILHLIDTPEALNEQVDEALAVLRAHGQVSNDQGNQPQAV